MTGSTYTPEPGDQVMFPFAPGHWNRTRVYEVTEVTLDEVCYKVAGEPLPIDGPYSASLELARKMGMSPAV